MIAIMQPTYMPWSGYFNLMASVEDFVFLDDVQFEKNSWQNRNRIIQNGSEVMLTIPVENRNMTTLIKDVEVSFSRDWRKKHIMTIRQSYSKAPFKEEALGLIIPVLEKKNIFLMEYTVSFILSIMSALELDSKIHFSSNLEVDGKRSERLLSICNKLSISEYLSPMGSKTYLEADGLLSKCNVSVKYQQYYCFEYPQDKVKSFVPHMSILDLVANIGIKASKEYILQNKMVKNV